MSSEDKQHSALKAAAAALGDACHAAVIYGDQPPQMYLDALDAVHAALRDAGGNTVPAGAAPFNADPQGGLTERRELAQAGGDKSGVRLDAPAVSAPFTERRVAAGCTDAP